MKKLIFVFLIILSSPAFAETYAVERADGGVTIIDYNESANQSLETTLNDFGLSGRPIKRVLLPDFPSDRKDRKYWKMNDVPIGKKIIIDTVKKDADKNK